MVFVPDKAVPVAVNSSAPISGVVACLAVPSISSVTAVRGVPKLSSGKVEWCKSVVEVKTG